MVEQDKECSEMFTRRCAMKRHLRNHHGMTPLAAKNASKAYFKVTANFILKEMSFNKSSRP